MDFFFLNGMHNKSHTTTKSIVQDRSFAEVFQMFLPTVMAWQAVSDSVTH